MSFSFFFFFPSGQSCSTVSKRDCLKKRQWDMTTAPHTARMMVRVIRFLFLFFFIYLLFHLHFSLCIHPSFFPFFLFLFLSFFFLFSAGNLETERDMTDVRDSAHVMVDMLERSAPGQVYNVCSNRAVKVCLVFRG